MRQLSILFQVYQQIWAAFYGVFIILFIGLSPAYAQSDSLVPDATIEQALRIAQKIEQNNLILNLPSDVNNSTLDKSKRLRALRIMSMNAAMFRNNPDKDALYARYKTEAERQNSQRDIKIAMLFLLQKNLMNTDHSIEPALSVLQTLHNYQDDPDWFVAQRAALLESSLQIYGRQFDIGLKDAQLALNLIPNKLGADYDEARYETYDFISYLQLILYNIEDGVGTTELVLETGLKSGRQIDGISLINNMAYSFENWHEYETAEKLAEILFKINNRSDQGINALVYLRYAQAQNNAKNYSGALATIDTALEHTKDPARKIGLVSERAITLAGLGRVREAEQEFTKFDNIAKINKIDTAGYQGKRLYARNLIAIAEGDVKTANNIQNARTKTIIQRLLRFQNEGIQDLHASLENEKQRQEERADALKREAFISKIAALLLGLLAIAMFAVAVLAIKLAKSIQKEKDAMEIAKMASEAGERAKKQFLSVMSHEFRTPLNGIIGIADLLSQSGQSQALRDQSKIMLESGEGLLELLTGILDMTYLESGDLVASTEPADIREVVQQIYQTMSERVNSKEIAFTCGVADDVPESLMLDVTRVTRSLKNLVSNAVKFTHEGRIHIHITTKPAQVSEGEDDNLTELSIIVIDTGIGISDEMQKNLFKPFVQADSSITRNYGGAGIGLAVSRGFVRLMGGDIIVMSKLGQGSEFSMYLKTIDVAVAKVDPVTNLPLFTCVPNAEHGISFDPVTSMEELKERKRLKQLKQERDATPDSAQNIVLDTVVPLVHEQAARLKLERLQKSEIFGSEADKPHLKNKPTSPDQFEGLNVLIVEDILANQEVVCSILEPKGCRVSTACNGREALGAMETQVFDVILMDIRMPIMNGIEATEHIRKYEGPHQNVPIVALTADASAENNAQCLAAGADVFLTKPVIISELFSSIRFVREKKIRQANKAMSKTMSA